MSKWQKHIVVAKPKKWAIVVDETSKYSNIADVLNPNIGEHTHEEADTLIPMHVLDECKTDGAIRDIDK